MRGCPRLFAPLSMKAFGTLRSETRLTFTKYIIEQRSVEKILYLRNLEMLGCQQSPTVLLPCSKREHFNYKCSEEGINVFNL